MRFFKNVIASLFVLVGFSLLSVPVAHAQPPTCTLIQITDTTGGINHFADLNSAGSRIAFASSSDPLGSNADGNQEIFVYDLTTSTLAQITNTSDGSNRSPSISDAGNRIAFASDSSTLGTNPDGNQEIYLYDTTTSTLTQVTNTTGISSSNPSISGNGSRIAFQSDGDLTGGNSDGNDEIFLYDFTTLTFTQVTDSSSVSGQFSRNPSTSSDGRFTAFVSNADLTGGNADGSVEVFRYDNIGGTFIQLTDDFAFVVHLAPSISGNGNLVAFNALNALFATESIIRANASTTTLTPIIISPAGSNYLPSISGDGNFIAFGDVTDPLGTNGDGNREIFLFDTVTSAFTQITTSTGGSNANPNCNGDGSSIVFDSDRDLTGSNADGNREIFLRTCGQLPVITGQPADQTITIGNSASLTVTATGTAPLTYQWYVGASGDTSNPVAGATGSTFVPSPTTTTSFWVRATNTLGSADSNSATVTVTAAPPSTSTQINVFDPAISKIGLLQPGQTGVVGEQLEWIVTVTNNGAVAGRNVVVSDTLVDALRIDRVDTPVGTVTIANQTVMVTIPQLNPGQSVRFSIFTTVLQGTSIPNTVCVDADNLIDPVCYTTSAIRELPRTGETPVWRSWIMPIAAGLVAHRVR